MVLSSLKKFTNILAAGILFSILYSLFSISLTYAATPFALDWVTDTYTPSEYMGKKLPVEGSKITVTVTPLTASATKYYYKWYLDGVRQNDWDATRSQFTFTAGRRDANVELKVGRKVTRTVAGKAVITTEEAGTERIIIRIGTPELMLYVEQGGQASLVRETTIAPGTTTRFRAIPYFYNVSLPSALRFRWNFLGNEVKGEDTSPDVLILSVKKDAARLMGILTVFAEDVQKTRASSEVRIKVQ